MKTPKRHVNGSVRPFASIKSAPTKVLTEVQLTAEDRNALRDAYNAEQAATSKQQSLELRMRAEVMTAQAEVVEAQQARVAVMNRLGRDYGFDPGPTWRFDRHTGSLTLPPPAPQPNTSRLPPLNLPPPPE